MTRASHVTRATGELPLLRYPGARLGSSSSGNICEHLCPPAAGQHNLLTRHRRPYCERREDTIQDVRYDADHGPRTTDHERRMEAPPTIRRCLVDAREYTHPTDCPLIRHILRSQTRVTILLLLRVFVAARTHLLSRCLATIGWATHR
jgi:hypothetical protein